MLLIAIKAFFRPFCKVDTEVKSHENFTINSRSLIETETFEIPACVFKLPAKRYILDLISAFERTFFPLMLSNASIEFTFILLELKFMVYLKVPLPSLCIVKSSINSIQEESSNNSDRQNKNSLFIAEFVRQK